MKDIEKVSQELHLDTQLTLGDIPQLELYMDQVIQLFENKYEKTKRFSDEKILTKTMINNYSKGKLFFPIKSKKYTPEHIMLMNLIYEMKTALGLRDIKQTLDKLNERIIDDAVDVSSIYEQFIKQTKSNLDHFQLNSTQIAEEVKKQTEELGEDTYLENMFLILSLVNMSNYYRRAAEAIIDQMKEPEVDSKKDGEEGV